jgi:hypothetical protein
MGCLFILLIVDQHFDDAIVEALILRHQFQFKVVGGRAAS